MPLKKTDNAVPPGDFIALDEGENAYAKVARERDEKILLDLELTKMVH